MQAGRQAYSRKLFHLQDRDDRRMGIRMDRHRQTNRQTDRQAGSSRKLFDLQDRDDGGICGGPPNAQLLQGLHQLGLCVARGPLAQVLTGCHLFHPDWVLLLYNHLLLQDSHWYNSNWNNSNWNNSNWDHSIWRKSDCYV